MNEHPMFSSIIATERPIIVTRNVFPRQQVPKRISEISVDPSLIVDACLEKLLGLLERQNIKYFNDAEDEENLIVITWGGERGLYAFYANTRTGYMEFSKYYNGEEYHNQILAFNDLLKSENIENIFK